jgi:hypothetical protein
LDGPPEIALKFEQGIVTVNAVTGKACKPVDGGTIVITAAKGIEEQQEADLTFRVRYRTQHSNSSTWTGRYHLLIFPAAEQASKRGDAGRSVVENKETVTPPIPVRVSRQPSADANRPEQPHPSTIGAGTGDAVPTGVLPPNRPLVQPERDLAAPVPTTAIEAPVPRPSRPLALHTTIVDGYRIEKASST